MSESRTRNTLRNAFFGTFNQIITLLLHFINRTIFIKVLGEEYLGISGLFTDILMMLSMADLGFGTAMVYSFYKPLAEKNLQKISALLKFYKKIYLCIALIVGIIGLGLIPFLKNIVNLTHPIPYLEIYYLFFLANSVISYLFVYKTSIIYADQKNYILSKYQMWINITRTILQSILLLVTKNFFLYLLLQVISTFINNFISSRKAHKLYPFLNENSIDLDNTEKKRIFQNMKSIFIYKLSSVLLNGTDNILISIMIGTIWVGYYSNYKLILSGIESFISILYLSVTASIGNVIVKEKPAKRYGVFQSMQTISLILSSFITVCLFILINDFIYVWLGQRFVLENIILVSIILNFYLGSIVHPIWTYREATGLYIKTKYIMLIAAIVNLFLSIIMGKYIGLAGILYASAISRLATYFWYEPALLFKEYFNVKVRNFYYPLFINAIFTISLIIILRFITSYFIIDSWTKLIIKALAVLLITLLTVLAFYHRTNGFRVLLNKLRNLKS
jgi:O-antigen/teichoic acid export membrane protein